MCIFILAWPLVFCNKLFSIKEAFKDLCWYMLWRSLTEYTSQYFLSEINSSSRTVITWVLSYFSSVGMHKDVEFFHQIFWRITPLNKLFLFKIFSSPITTSQNQFALHHQTSNNTTHLFNEINQYSHVYCMCGVTENLFTCLISDLTSWPLCSWTGKI
jgi:hypothetical protein